jgi:phospholipid/cholesterol/gamma-HCH transport system substrate-binding protein
LIARAGPTIDRTGRAAAAVENMAEEAARVSAGAGRLIDGIAPDVKRFTAQTLPEIERLAVEMTVLSTSLRRLSEQIERSPGGILFGRRPVPPGPGE